MPLSPPKKPRRTFIPTSQTIPLLPTGTARLYTHLHPLLLLSLSYFRFPTLVADPVPALISHALPLAVLQIVYVITCLPYAGVNSVVGSKHAKRRKPGQGKSKDVFSLTRKITPALLSLFLALFPTTPLLTIILILFGAPLTTHFFHNLLCATHMALLAFLPLFYVYGVDAKMWREICSASLPFDTVWGGCIGTVVGAWLGAIPIPLDWDREWQKWPVTIVTGSYLGWGFGRLAGEYLIRGKRVEFD